MEHRDRIADNRASLVRRFGAYALGIGIGLMFLGLIQSQRAARRASMPQESSATILDNEGEAASDRGSGASEGDDLEVKPPA